MKTNAQWEPVTKHGNPIKHLYLRQPSGTFYARLYQNGKNKYVNLGTSVYTIARSKLAEVLAEHTTAWTIKSDAKDGSLVVGQLAALYLQSVDADTGIRQSTKDCKRDCVQRMFKLPESCGTLAQVKWTLRNYRSALLPLRTQLQHSMVAWTKRERFSS